MRRDTRSGKAWILRGLAAVVLAVTFGYVPYRLYARSGYARYRELRHDWVAAKSRNARMRAENERLAREVEALRTDPRVLEQVARAEMGWVRPSEILFDFGEAR
ncbi:MAG TPA: septum formation initiator family protein [Polyangia bacterium]|jgi:Septum formation initiator|nr:septum formation initiator family protein [Polyangia bacterium]